MDLTNFNGFELRNFYFTTVQKLFSTIFIGSGKMHDVELNSGTSKSSKFSFYLLNFIRLKILTYENPMESYIKNRVKLWDQIEFKG